MNGTFAERLEAVRRRVADACARAGRRPEEVTILPVAKKFGAEAVCEAAAAGVTAIGESRVQEARQKIPLCPGHLLWHMIGHLQRNKVREAVALFDMIHAVDSWRLLEAVETACAEEGKRLPVLLEVNVSGERSKFGLPPDEAAAVLERCGSLAHVRVEGLMTMPPFLEDPEATLPFFRRLRELRDEWRGQFAMELPELSMGMSHDFEAAVMEGATWVRLGTALFGERPSRAATEGARQGATEAEG